MTLCMGVMPMAFTLIIYKAAESVTTTWSSDVVGTVFMLIHMGLFVFGAWIYAVKVGN